MEKQKINYEGFLIESKMQNIISQVNGVENLRFNEKDRFQTKFEWDSVFEYGGKTIVIEFDSHFHYQNPKTIINDKFKDMECKNRGWEIYRIPYFVQLTSDTTELLTPFKNIEINTNYKHGFIKSKKYPAGYCYMGLERFEKELNSLPEKVSNQICLNLYECVYKYHCSDQVVPSWFFEIYLQRFEES